MLEALRAWYSWKMSLMQKREVLMIYPPYALYELQGLAVLDFAIPKEDERVMLLIITYGAPLECSEDEKMEVEV